VNGRPPRTRLALAVVSAAAAFAYAPSFGVPFQFDDSARLGGNWPLQHGGFLQALLWLGNSRLVPALTLVLNYRLGGFNPVGYHVVNFAVHLITTVGVFELALALCRTPRLRGGWPAHRSLLLATAAALLFACHPLQTQAVTYIIQRYASMAALFYVWAVVCYLRVRNRYAGVESGRPAPYIVATALLAACAALSKENAASLPAALLLTEWVGYGFPRNRRAIAIGAALLIVVLALPLGSRLLFWQPYVPRDTPSTVPLSGRLAEVILAPRASVPGRPSPLTYLLTQATVLPRYLRLVVLPWGQNIDHDVPLARSLSAPVVAGGAFLAGLAFLGLWQVRRRPLLAFAICWFFITLSVESSLFPISDVMMEHRMYLPMAGLALGGAWLFTAAAAWAPRGALAAGAVVVAGLVTLTIARNVVWRSPLTLWLDAADKSPGRARSHVNLGAVYHVIGRLDDAFVHFCRALAIDPDDTVASDNLEIVLEAQGKLDQVAVRAVERRPDGSVLLETADVSSSCPQDTAHEDPL
jgi:protein O-mannosyl-transferase